MPDVRPQLGAAQGGQEEGGKEGDLGAAIRTGIAVDRIAVKPTLRTRIAVPMVKSRSAIRNPIQ